MNKNNINQYINELDTLEKVNPSLYESQILMILSHPRKFHSESDHFAEHVYKFLVKLRKNKVNIYDKLGDWTIVECIRTGEYFIDNKQYQKAWQFVDVFKNYPPSELYKRLEKLDEEVMRGDPNATTKIATPLAHLAWFVQRLIIESHSDDRKNLIKGFEITKNFLDNLENYYLISQWLVPLIEISKRRLWLLIEDQENNKTHYYHELKILFFNKDKGIIARYSDNITLSNLIIHSLNYIRELKTSEVKYILTELDKAPDYEVLLIYFAIFRESHYNLNTRDKEHLKVVKMLLKNGKTTLDYDPSFAKTRLTNLLKDESHESEKYQGRVAWNFYHLLKEETEHYSKIEPYVDLLFKLPFKRHVVINLRMLLSVFPYKNYSEQFINYTKILLHTMVKNPKKIQKYYLYRWYQKDELLEKIREVADSKQLAAIEDKFMTLESYSNRK